MNTQILLFGIFLSFHIIYLYTSYIHFDFFHEIILKQNLKGHLGHEKRYFESNILSLKIHLWGAWDGIKMKMLNHVNLKE